MDRPARCILWQGRPVVLRVARHIQQAAQNFVAHRHRNRPAGCPHAHPARQPRSGLKRHSAQRPKVKMAVDLQDKLSGPVPVHDKGRVDGRQVVARKDHIHDSTSDGMNGAAWGGVDAGQVLLLRDFLNTVSDRAFGISSDLPDRLDLHPSPVV
jgi:hypothetical protein